jgi:hypothetical protein
LCNRFPHIGIKFMSVLNSIALRQLQVTLRALTEKSNVAAAHSLQFETYYTGEHMPES